MGKGHECTLCASGFAELGGPLSAKRKTPGVLRFGKRSSSFPDLSAALKVPLFRPPSPIRSVHKQVFECITCPPHPPNIACLNAVNLFRLRPLSSRYHVFFSFILPVCGAQEFVVDPLNSSAILGAWPSINCYISQELTTGQSLEFLKVDDFCILKSLSVLHYIARAKGMRGNAILWCM